MFSLDTLQKAIEKLGKEQIFPDTITVSDKAFSNENKPIFILHIPENFQTPIIDQHINIVFEYYTKKIKKEQAVFTIDELRLYRKSILKKNKLKGINDPQYISLYDISNIEKNLSNKESIEVYMIDYASVLTLRHFKQLVHVMSSNFVIYNKTQDLIFYQPRLNCNSIFYYPGFVSTFGSRLLPDLPSGKNKTLRMADKGDILINIYRKALDEVIPKNTQFLFESITPTSIKSHPFVLFQEDTINDDDEKTSGSIQFNFFIEISNQECNNLRAALESKKNRTSEGSCLFIEKDTFMNLLKNPTEHKIVPWSLAMWQIFFESLEINKNIDQADDDNLELIIDKTTKPNVTGCETEFSVFIKKRQKMIDYYSELKKSKHAIMHIIKFLSEKCLVEGLKKPITQEETNNQYFFKKINNGNLLKEIWKDQIPEGSLNNLATDLKDTPFSVIFFNKTKKEKKILFEISLSKQIKRITIIEPNFQRKDISL